jgi:hypothetical protein
MARTIHSTDHGSTESDAAFFCSSRKLCKVLQFLFEQRPYMRKNVLPFDKIFYSLIIRKTYRAKYTSCIAMVLTPRFFSFLY